MKSVILLLMRDEDKTKEQLIAELRQLRLIEQRSRIIFEQAPIGIAIKELYADKFIQVNRAYCDIIGYCREEVLSDTFKELTYPHDIRPELDNMQRLISGEISVFKMEKRYIRRDHRVVWVNLTCVPLWIGNEQPVFHIAMIENITDSKRTVQKGKVEVYHD
ncbi:PAS domain protein [Candidatus Magnetobacterium bavaricum]|uniref:histidine kinase n=1 Tax=Candidatus Magnetobacterium bavaricum TaxID=29290 RepID=A0A0F3GR58_9BACT|nr:PAS domain protein [Candidatus Magnetobacterium bavaricum]